MEGEMFGGDKGATSIPFRGVGMRLRSFLFGQEDPLVSFPGQINRFGE